MGQVMNKAISRLPLPAAVVTWVEPKKVNRDSIEFLAKVSVNNPLCLPIPLCDITFNLTTAGRELAKGKVAAPGTLKGRGVTVLDVTMTVPYDALISLGRDIGADWGIDYELDIGLIVDFPVVGNITIPVSKKGEIKLPTLKDFIKLPF
ncbi:PREDICTED: desiccation protectant protein Lea14 homolog [Tarenaya hassleriana]|uniref:desiccation protectant protein Lea14 homolog n=1 Tax=Tarenaya hassleriana TaxID=28532 RepID=UPI00053C7778|nr:PREDICTED: desiccation protectant protein Lea14 homolog [Tarenaya hassleriana]